MSLLLVYNKSGFLVSRTILCCDANWKGLKILPKSNAVYVSAQVFFFGIQQSVMAQANLPSLARAFIACINETRMLADENSRHNIEDLAPLNSCECLFKKRVFKHELTYVFMVK